MSKHLMCSVCDAVFSQEDSFIEHFKEKHIQIENETFFENDEILSKLKNDFPNLKIDKIQYDDHMANFLFYVHDGDCLIEQFYQPQSEYYSFPRTYDELVADIKWKISKKDELLKKISNIGTFDEIICEKFDYGYSDDEHSFNFRFKTKGSKNDRFESFYPWAKDQSEDEFVRNFKRFFVKTLEGEVVSYYEGGYFVGYKIDGVLINELLLNANHAKLKIID